MKRAQFEEGQYADAANAELALGTGLVFNPGQVLEGLLAFDVAADPMAAWIWAALQLRAKQGVRLHHRLLPRSRQAGPRRFPPHLLSVIVQYKRPGFQDAASAPRRNAWGRAYFEFAVRKRQHPRLQQLEAAISKRGVVRYAAPAFWQASDLFQRQMSQSVLANSIFVSPTQVGPSQTKWTYVEPGRSHAADARSEELGSEQWDDLARVLVAASTKQTISEHIAELAQTLRRERLVARGPVVPELNVPRGEDKERWNAKVRDFFTIADAVERAGAQWLVVGLHDRKRTELQIRADKVYHWWYTER
ncbi:MAG TPA: hypothetical protein VG963_06730 [Polyangiaceae bacterium]|nr:hypothetical protein [Polyangiaceae bacterium]